MLHDLGKVNLFAFYGQIYLFFKLSTSLSSACTVMAQWLHGQWWDQTWNLQGKREAHSTVQQT